MAAPVAPAAPLLEAAGTGKLRVRFAAPPAEPACSEMAVYLRTIGGGVPWRAVNGATHRLVIQEGTGSCVPMRLGDRELIGTVTKEHKEAIRHGDWATSMSSCGMSLASL